MVRNTLAGGLQVRTNTAARNVLLEFNIFIKEEM